LIYHTILGHHLNLGRDVHSQVQTCERVEDAVQRFAALGQRNQIALVHLGEGIVQGPEIARAEVLMSGLLPLVEYVRNHRLANRAAAIAAQDQIARLLVVQFCASILRDAGFVIGPHVAEHTDCTAHDLGEIAQDVCRVTTTKHDLVVEAKIVTDEWSIARADASGETLVVRIAQAHYGARRTLLAHVDLKEAKVPLTVACGRVVLLDDREIRNLQLLAEDRNEIRVRYGLIGIGLDRCSYAMQVSKRDNVIFAATDIQVQFSFHFMFF